MQTQKMIYSLNSSRILLVGNIEAAFLDRLESDSLHLRRCSTMLEAVHLASEQKFETICIVMAGFGAQARTAIKSLRQVSPDSKIILLVQMYEEPFAIEMVNSPQAKSGYADDYAICPLTAKKFFSDVLCRRDELQIAHAEAEQDAQTLEQLARLATEDELTGLKNRRYAREFLRQIIDRAKKENMRLTLLIFDIDDFKHYNDVYGHPAGDDILRQAAVLMRTCCRKHDVVARIGGDEFAVIFWDAPKDTDLENGRRIAQGEHPKEIFFIAERFRKELNQTHLPSLGPEGKGVLTISGGLAGFPRDGADVEGLFEQADKGLLEAKKNGKNRIYLIGEAKENKKN